MTLTKAIAIQSDSVYNGITTFNQDFKDSQKLGIEALKAWKEHRGAGSLMDPLLLPGETPPEEED